MEDDTKIHHLHERGSGYFSISSVFYYSSTTCGHLMTKLTVLNPRDVTSA
jgi:hypothetical protein